MPREPPFDGGDRPTLGIAAPYLEDKIQILLYMDYVKQVGNKYQTNFYILENNFFLASARFQYELMLKVAVPILCDAGENGDQVVLDFCREELA